MNALLETDLLQTFVAIADTGGFSHAARRVFRTQSAVSMQMRRLEQTLGRSLFERQGRSVRLTADGELLLGHARRILHAQQQALAAFDHSTLEGSVVFGTPDDYGSTFLPTILARFAETNPRIHVEVVCEPTINLLPRLADGSVDMALITHGHGDDSGVIVHQEPMVWVTSARHCAHEQDPLPLALYQPGCPFRQRALDGLAALGRASRVAYTSVSLTGIEAALRAGLAVSVLGLSNVTEGLRVLTESEGFPPMPDYTIALRRAPGKESPLLDRVEQHIVASFSAFAKGKGA